jgi:hypothetical protein
VGGGRKKIRKINKIIARLGWGQKEVQPKQKVGSRLSKGKKKSEPVLTSLVNTRMKK